jgi:hypothetical protein
MAGCCYAKCHDYKGRHAVCSDAAKSWPEIKLPPKGLGSLMVHWHALSVFLAPLVIRKTLIYL